MDPALDQVPAEQAGSGADPVGWAVFPGGAAADSHLGVVCPWCVYGAVVLTPR